jgi:hypothetical protein
VFLLSPFLLEKFWAYSKFSDLELNTVANQGGIPHPLANAAQRQKARRSRDFRHSFTEPSAPPKVHQLNQAGHNNNRLYCRDISQKAG